MKHLFFHVNRMTRELEQLLTIQQQVSNNIFYQLTHSRLDERICNITEWVQWDSSSFSSSSSPVSDIICQDSSSPAVRATAGWWVQGWKQASLAGDLK
jgi:hypothetical protein